MKNTLFIIGEDYFMAYRQPTDDELIYKQWHNYINHVVINHGLDAKLIYVISCIRTKYDNKYV